MTIRVNESEQSWSIAMRSALAALQDNMQPSTATMATDRA